MLDKPDAKDLLEAMAAFLANDVIPELSGRKRFHALVAANLARILARESELAPVIREREIERLSTLLGQVGESGAKSVAVRTDRGMLEAELCRELVRRIEEGQADAGPWRDEVYTYLRESVADKLRIDNPKML